MNTECSSSKTPECTIAAALCFKIYCMSVFHRQVRNPLTVHWGTLSAPLLELRQGVSHTDQSWLSNTEWMLAGGSRTLSTVVLEPEAVRRRRTAPVLLPGTGWKGPGVPQLKAAENSRTCSLIHSNL